jgi:hypothetical protein
MSHSNYPFDFAFLGARKSESFLYMQLKNFGVGIEPTKTKKLGGAPFAFPISFIFV